MIGLRNLSLILCLIVLTEMASGLSWNKETVDSSGRLGDFISLALDQSGNIHLCYYDSVSRDLLYAKRSGSAPWSISAVDTLGDVGRFCALALGVNGRPCISYYDSTGRCLKYASYDGTVWMVETADLGPGVGYYTSLVTGASGPSIAYYDQGQKDLKLAQKPLATWSLARIDSSGNTGRFASAALSSSNLVSMAYYSDTLNLLLYAHYQNGWKFQNPDPQNYCGHHVSLVLGSNGHPRLAYLDSIKGQVKYALRTNPVQWVCEVADSSGQAFGAISLALDPLDNPVIAYQDRIQGRLCLAYKAGSLWSKEIIDSTIIGFSPALCRIGPDTTIYLSYRDSRGYLRLARSFKPDLTPPVVSSISIIPDTISENAFAILRAAISDNRAVSGAEYFIDSIGQPGAGRPLRFESGFGTTLANVRDTIYSSGLSSGRHRIHLHGLDSNGLWGSYDSVDLYILSRYVLNEFLPEPLVYVWPNPARGDRVYFHYYVNVDAEMTAEVFDLDGRLVARISGRGHGGLAPHSVNSNHLVWDISGISSDVYLLRLTASGAGGQKASVIKKFAVVK